MDETTGPGNPNDETRMTNQARKTNDQSHSAIRHWSFVIDSEFRFRHSDFPALTPLASRGEWAWARGARLLLERPPSRRVVHWQLLWHRRRRVLRIALVALAGVRQQLRDRLLTSIALARVLVRHVARIWMLSTAHEFRLPTIRRRNAVGVCNFELPLVVLRSEVELSPADFTQRLNRVLAPKVVLDAQVWNGPCGHRSTNHCSS